MPGSKVSSALILAGGRSTRMGTDKALLDVEGVPMLRRVYNVARQVVGDAGEILVVSPWPERYREIIPDACRWLIEPDVDPPDGPLSGFILGLGQVKTGWVLALACDLPRLDAQVLLGGVAKLDALTDPVLALLPRSEQAPWDPLCGFYRSGSLESTRAYYAAGGRSFQGWLAGVTVEPLSAPPAMLVNCNTPADLERVRGTSLPPTI